MPVITGPTCCDGGITGYGSTDSGIMFIGIAPGADEWRRTKRPLTGPSGKLLDAVLSAFGIPRSTVYCTNLICYWKDAPTKDEISVCSTRLQAEIALVKPKVIVLLGKLACEAILEMPFSKARGAVIQRGGITYLATYHPAASLHKGVTPAEKEVQINAAYDLVRDLKKLDVLADNDIVRNKPITHEVVTDQDRAQEILNTLSLTGLPVAIDIETNFDKEYDKSHPFDNDIVCIGVGYSDDHAYVLTQQVLAGLTWPKDVKWVFHNGAFDTQEIARHYGVWLPIGDDTMLMSYSCDERSIRGLHKLKHLAREFCGSDFYEEDDHRITLDSQQDQQEQLGKLYEYNAKDVVYTWRLHEYLRDWQLKENVQGMYESLLLPAAEMLAQSQLRGIYVSPKNMLNVIEVFEPQFEQAQQELQAISAFAGFPELNVNSPKQLMAMFASEGYNIPNTRKATLQDILDSGTNNKESSDPFISTLLRYRTLHKLIRNYLLDIQKHVKHDSRVHPHAFLIGTSTGRLTYRDPAMQTLPKPKTVKDLGIIRSIFSATNDDYILVEADYAQIEAWVAACLSEDDVLLADLQSGNWHTLVTEDVFGIKKATTQALDWAFYYDGGKHLNYGCLYEEGPEGLTRRPPIGMGCDYKTALEYHKRWHARYYKFDIWRAKIKKQAMEIGYVDTPFGRKRRFPFIVNDHQLRQAVNSPIQSVANDYTLSSSIRMYRQLRDEYDTHLLFLEHDAGYWEVNRQYYTEALQLIKDTMERPPLPGLPSIKVEIEAGPNLAELVKI